MTAIPNQWPTDLTSVTPPKAWSIAAIAASLGVSAGFLRNEIKRGRLKARKVGRRVLVFDVDLRRYLGEEDASEIARIQREGLPSLKHEQS
jgi:excisionase family DNA binding protein